MTGGASGSAPRGSAGEPASFFSGGIGGQRPPTGKLRNARRLRKLLLLAAIPAILLARGVVLADRPHVVILGPSPDHPAVTRARGELATLGIDVDVVVQSRDTADLAAVARRFGAAAVLRVESAPPAIVLWVGPTAGADAPAEVRVGGVTDEGDPGLLALRAVEVLRARLLEVPSHAAAASHPPDQDAALEDHASPALDAGEDGGTDAGTDAGQPAAAADAGPPSARAERPRPVGLSAGPAVLASPGGVPAAFQVRLGAEWDPLARLGLEAMAFLPATAGTVTAAEGAMDLRVFTLGGGIRGLVTDPAADVFVALGLGVEAVMLSFSGSAAAPWAAESGSHWAAAPYLFAAAAYRLHPRLSLRLDVQAALVRPEPVLRIAGREVASFGQPAILPSLALEVRP